jgi:hypothetical protein
MSIVVCPFATRHFSDDFVGTKVTGVDAHDFNAALAAAEIREAGAGGGVRHIIVANFTDTLAGVAEITDANRHLLVSEYKARREGELPVLTRHFPAGAVRAPVAEYLHLVLYSAEQCAKEGEDIGDADWGIVSINAGMTPEVTPLNPAAQMRNAMGTEAGGNGKPLDPEAYAAGVAYWSRWATVG